MGGGGARGAGAICTTMRRRSPDGAASTLCLFAFAMSTRKSSVEKERRTLGYRLLPGEERCRTVRAGAEIHWSRVPARGAARGTVVLLHGVASNGSRWEEFLDTTALREDWDFIRLDLRGHAASADWHRVRLEDWCEDIAAILDDAAVKRAVVVGHSLGAQIAMKFGTDRPDRVLGIALLDPLVDEALTDKALAMRKKVPMLHAGENFFRAMNRIGFVREIVPQDLRAMDAGARQKIAKGGRELEEFIEQYSSARADLQYIHSATYLRDLQEVGRATPEAALFTFPTLVIGSSAGTFTDAGKMRAWCEKLPHGRMRVVQCAHWPMTECPQDVSRAIEEWVEDL